MLDWEIILSTEWSPTYEVHDVAEALREISKTLAKWREGASGQLAVVVCDGDARDRRSREQRMRRRAEQTERERDA